MALGINGEVISRAYALGPARGGRGLCATVCTPTWVFFFLCVCADARMCTLAVKGHPQQESLIDSRRIRREANTGANKCALVQSQLHVLALLCRQLLLQEMTPSWLASTINELSSWNTTKMSMFSCIFFFFGPHIPILYIYDLTKLCLRRINGYCLQTQRKRCWLLFPHVLHKSAMHSKTAHGAAWCNAAACTCTAKGYTASGAGSNTPCK